MLNDIIFNDEKSAYDDWNIVLTKAEIPLPTPKTSIVDIKGADGVIDLSETLTGDIQYNNRPIKLTFELLDDTDYYESISTISNYIHGQVVTFVLTNDDEYYYKGRASIIDWECNKRIGKIVIQVDAEPYKQAVVNTIRTITVNNQTKTVTLVNSRKRVCPIINATGTVKLIIGSKEYTLSQGNQQLTNFVLVEGNNTIIVSGNGTVVITYRQGML